MRLHRLIDCAPVWGEDGGRRCWLRFKCPEGHVDCEHIIAFTPALDGTLHTPKHAVWQRSGTGFDDLTLDPSIRRIPPHASREAAIAAGCTPEYITESLLCAMHINITAGAIVFHADSR